MDQEKKPITKEAEEKKDETGKKKGRMKKIILAILIPAAIAGAAFGAYYFWQDANFLVTDNARVTTTLISITSSVPGKLERFSVYEGKYVEENEILGWAENGTVMRSPVRGMVIHTNAVVGQSVSAQQSLAVIADTSAIHIQANIEETYISKIQEGQSVFITIDPFGTRQFSGIVREIDRVTQAELSGSTLSFNTGGTFTRVTRLIPVKIFLTEEVNLNHLIGVNAKVRISLRPPAGSSGSGFANISSVPAENISAAGIVESVQKRNVYSSLAFPVERIHVTTGESVDEGQILGVLNTDDLQIQMSNAGAALRIAEVNSARAEHNHEIRKVLYNASAISQDEMRQSEFALQTAIASRQQAQAQYDAVRNSLDKSVIRSPIRGTVTEIFAREGASGMGLLFIVEDTENLKITTGFRESDLARVKTGMEVVITSDATGIARHKGIISRINPATAKNAAGVSLPNALFEAEVLVAPQATGLRIGMNVRLEIALR